MQLGVQADGPSETLVIVARADMTDGCVNTSIILCNQSIIHESIWTNVELRTPKYYRLGRKHAACAAQTMGADMLSCATWCIETILSYLDL